MTRNEMCNILDSKDIGISSREPPLKIGDRIKVVNIRSKYNGYYGYIYSINKTHVRVFLDGTRYKPGKPYDCSLEMKRENVILVSEEGLNMNKLTGFKKVAVVKIGNIYYHFALYDDDINVGDNVLVSGSCKDIVTVNEIISSDEAKEITDKTIIAEVKCKVDLSKYNERVENRKKAEQLKKEMDKKIAEMDEINKYVMYAERNDELAKMLEEYKELVY